MFKILGAENRQKNLHKHPGPPFQIRRGPGSFSIAEISVPLTTEISVKSSIKVDETSFKIKPNEDKIWFLHFTNWQSWRNNVHFLILKNTKKFINFWWLNIGTESDLTIVWIFYCVLCAKLPSKRIILWSTLEFSPSPS